MIEQETMSAQTDTTKNTEVAMQTSVSRRDTVEEEDGELDEESEDFDFVVRPAFRFKRFCFDGMEKSNNEEIEKYARASSYATFDDLHLVLDQEFSSLQKTELSPLIKDMWWNDDAKMDQYASETVAGKFVSETIQNGVGHPLLQQQLHVKLVNLYGTRLFSLSQHRLIRHYAHRNNIDRQGHSKEAGGGEKKELQLVQGASAFNESAYTYFSFALLDARGHQVPLLAEICDRHGVVYGFDKGVKSQVVGTVSDTHEDGVLVSVDLELLRKSVPSFSHYEPHGEFTSSFLRHRQGLLAARSFIMGCTVQGKLAQLNYMWVRKEDERNQKQSALQSHGIKGLLALEKEAELKYHEEFGVNSTDHVEFRGLVSTLSDQQKLQIEIELGVAAAIGSIHAMIQHKPAELLHTLADLQPVTVREKFTQLVKAKSGSPSESSSSSTVALIPELQRIVNEYAGMLVLPVVADEVSTDEASKQVWSKLAIVGGKRF